MSRRSRAEQRSHVPVISGALLLTVLTACGGGILGGGPSVPDPVLAPLPASARLLYDNTGGIQDSVRIVVQSAADFSDVWSRATAGLDSPPAAPSIDFGRDMVLVVASGRMTPEDQIRVDSVGVMRERTVDGDVRDVFSVIVRTTIGCGRFQSDAFPLEVVRVRRFDGKVNFEERTTRETNC